MSYYEDVTVTTAADGSATEYTKAEIRGRILAVKYIKSDFANGSTFTITTEDSGQTIWVESNVNASTQRAPRQATHLNTDGSAALYAAAGSPVLDYIWAGLERIKIVIASGGNAKTGTFRIFYG